MDKKIFAIIAATTLCFILGIKFGVEVFWLILAMGFIAIVLVIVSTLLLQVLFFDYYEKKLCPGFKRITGKEFPLETIPYERRTKIREGIAPLFFFVIVVSIFTYLIISGRLRIF